MKVHILLITMLCFVSIMFLPGGTNAQTIHVMIQGTEIACPAVSSPCDTTFNLTSYENNYIKILDFGGTAQVRKVDGDLDLLVLEHATIQAKGTLSNYDITFWRDLSGPPDAPPSSLVRFERRGKGTLRRGTNAATGDSVTVTGYVLGDEIAVSQTKTVCSNCTAPTFGDFNLAKTEDWNPLTGTRELKGEFWFSMNTANDELRLDMVQVQNLAPAGDSQGCKGDQCSAGGRHRSKKG